MRKTFMSMVETKKKEYSFSKFESYHNADPVFCAINGQPCNPVDGVNLTESQQLLLRVKMCVSARFACAGTKSQRVNTRPWLEPSMARLTPTEELWGEGGEGGRGLFTNPHTPPQPPPPSLLSHRSLSHTLLRSLSPSPILPLPPFLSFSLGAVRLRTPEPSTLHPTPEALTPPTMNPTAQTLHPKP